VKITAAGTFGLLLTFAFFTHSNFAYCSSNYKCKNLACDINAIGHRNLSGGRGVGNWYSTAKEKELGATHAAAVERKVEIVKDAGINAYVDQVAQRIAENSDADMPISVRIIHRDDVGAFVLMGGHLYVTTGLLMKLRGEGELASVIAHGIAHTAMRSVARLYTRGMLLEMASVPDSVPWVATTSCPMLLQITILPARRSGALRFQREFELEADYFAIQYVYKAGYDTECFLSAILSLWQPGHGKPSALAFDPFPPLPVRLKKLNQEIDDILPNQPGSVISSSEFDEFIGHLAQIAPPATKPVMPKLIRHDLSSE
jgi:predicted Zn-dependent protease